MTLKDIPEVSILPETPVDTLFEGERKYLMIKLVDSTQEKTVITIANRRFDSHEVMWKRFKKKYLQGIWMETFILGGGKLTPKEENALIVFDRSADYGPADHEKAAEILRKYFKENNIQTEVKVGPTYPKLV